MSKNKEYFTRFPNEYIRGNIKKKYGVSRKFYITYILIDKYRSYENYSWLTVRKVLDFYGYKTHRNKPRAFREILDVLEYMINNKMIEVKQELDSLDYDTGIEIRIIPENFDCPNNFCKISSSQLNVIMMNESNINKENLLLAFLYINSYIYVRPKDENGNELYERPSDRPEAFWRSIDTMSKELAMSKDTINQCINCLTESTGDQKPLLVKRELKNIPISRNDPAKTIPNIYVLNKAGYGQEIEWALSKILEIYDIHNIKSSKNKTDRKSSPQRRTINYENNQK